LPTPAVGFEEHIRIGMLQGLLHTDCCLADFAQGLLQDFQSLTNAAVNSSLNISAYFANTTGAWHMRYCTYIAHAQRCACMKEVHFLYQS
jgi:hypothetical protein